MCGMHRETPMEILCEPKFLVHESGTKFYEVVEFYNVAAGKFVSVNRWGKIAAQHGGGETKVGQFIDICKCQDAARKKLLEKSGRGYSERTVRFGLHAGTSKIESETLLSELRKHYSNEGVIYTILSGLDINDSLETVKTYSTASESVAEASPAFSRGEEWGSW